MAWSPNAWPEPQLGPEQKISWYGVVQGDVVEVFRTFNWRQFHPEKVRGTVKGFSHDSRMRMIRSVSKVNWQAIGSSLFITLTYPDECIKWSCKERTMHRHLFFRYLEKFVKTPISILWKMEWEERLSGIFTGKLAPHYHLIVCGVRRLPWQKVRAWWKSALQSEREPHTWVQRIVGEQGVVKYVCKYMSKSGSLARTAYLSNPLLTGRAWGWHRPSLLPMHPVEFDCKLTQEQVQHAQALATSEFHSYDAENMGGFTLFGEVNKKLFLAGMGKTC